MRTVQPTQIIERRKNQTVVGQAMIEAASKVIDTTRKQLEEEKPTLALRVEDIAKVIGLSESYVHAQIAKDKPKPVARDGKAKLYSEAYVEVLKARGSKPRMRFVKPLTNIRKPATLQAVQEGAPSSGASLLDRMAALEQFNQELKETIIQMRGLLGM